MEQQQIVDDVALRHPEWTGEPTAGWEAGDEVVIRLTVVEATDSVITFRQADGTITYEHPYWCRRVGAKRASDGYETGQGYM